MNKPTDTATSGARMPASRAATAHENWELRVQDWLDGAADTDEARAVQQHVAGCAACTQLIEDLRRIDEQLVATVPAEPGLSAQFDAQLFARVDEEQAARERVRKTANKPVPADELVQLQQAWRRSMLRIGGAAAAVIAVMAWVVASGAIPFLSPATIVLTMASLTPLQWISIGLGGGAIALALTRWLQAD